MNNLKKEILIYTGTCIIAIVTGLIVSHRQFSPNLDYRIRATDISIIWYTSVIFLLPLIVKYLLHRFNFRKYRGLFIFQFIIAVITSVVPISIMLDGSSVKSPTENYTFDFESDIYTLYIFCKFCTFILILLIVILLFYQIVIRLYKKYSL